MPDSHGPRKSARALPFIVLVAALPAARAEVPRYALTVYDNEDAQPLFASAVDFEPPPGYAIVHERRQTPIGAGPGTLTLNGFPRYLDAGALTVTLEHGRVLNQRFEAEPLHSEGILERSIGRQVTVEHDLGGQPSVLNGELLSASVPLVLRLADGSLVSVNDYSRIRLPSPPPGVSALPQLRLGVDSERAGDQRITLSYPTAGLAWRARYVAQLKPGRHCRLNFLGFAQIVNRSGHGFPGANIKLIAGEPQHGGGATTDVAAASTNAATSNAAFQYRLGTPVDLSDDSSQQVALVPVQRDVECKQERLYVGQALRAQAQRVPITAPGFGQGGEGTVRSTLSFALTEPVTIPAGRVRVLSEDGRDGTLEFIGEHHIGHTPAGQRLDLAIGDAPDLRGERSVSSFSLDPAGLAMSEVVQVRLRNQGTQTTSVRVREHLYRWTQWQILEHSQPFSQRDHDTIEFVVAVPGNGEATLSYRVTYRWTERFK